jgi:hypothetical protein
MVSFFTLVIVPDGVLRSYSGPEVHFGEFGALRSRPNPWIVPRPAPSTWQAVVPGYFASQSLSLISEIVSERVK